MSQLPLRDLEAQALTQKSASGALEFLRGSLLDDTRPAAQKLLAKFEKKVARDHKEQERLERLGHYEREGRQKGYRVIAGVDEAGRGPLAGPVVAGAVIFAEDGAIPGLDDSKKLSPQKREELFSLIQQKALAVGVGEASAQEIDRVNIYQAARLAMERAIEALSLKPDYLLTDAMPLPKFSNLAQKPLIHGDALSFTIAAASIVAKVTRDRWVTGLHERFPQYGFLGHKGYGTQEHMEALEKHGPCAEHRVTFAPILEALAKRSKGGALQFWKDRLAGAQSQKELLQVGLQVKRAGAPHLTAKDLEELRVLFRETKGKLK